jgi:4-hydroxybenzoate polyprenyltransferase
VSTNLRAYLQLMRLPALFTAMSNIVAAYLIATAGVIDWRTLPLLLLASSALYIGGMVLNDCFDLDVDASERPGRPLPSGQVDIRIAWALGWLLLITGIGLAGLVNTMSLLIAALLAAAIVLYNGLLKSTVLGALNMGLCRYLNWLLGSLSVAFTTGSLIIALPILVYVTSLTLVSRVESRGQTRVPLIIAAAGMMLTGGLFAWLFYLGLLSSLWALPLAGAALLFVIFRLAQTWRAFSPAGVQRLVGFLIFGIIPLDALLVLGAGQPWGSLAILLLIVPGRWLGRWMYIT